MPPILSPISDSHSARLSSFLGGWGGDGGVIIMRWREMWGRIWVYPLLYMHVHTLTLALRERGRLRQAGPSLQESLMSPRAASRTPPRIGVRGFRTAPAPSGATPPAAGTASASGGGGSIFWLLPAFNLAVLALELAYQVCM